MIWVAAAGVVMNGAITLLLMRGHRDINLRSALLHEIGDTLSTAAVIVGGMVIAITGQHWIDPALSVGIGVMILWSSIGIVRESLNILLEGTPSGMELERIERAIRAVPGVSDVHDLHVWSIGSDTHSLSCHVGHRRHAGVGERGHPGDDPRRCWPAASTSTTPPFSLSCAVCEVADGCVIPVSPGHSEHGHSH